MIYPELKIINDTPHENHDFDLIMDMNPDLDLMMDMNPDFDINSI